MNFCENHLYHIYNRGNNRQKIFFNTENYIFFKRKISKYISPVCDVLCYCLMPNHFHLLIYATEKTVQLQKIGLVDSTVLAERIRLLLSTYALAINKQHKRSGSLFQQNTKAKCIDDGDEYYGSVCFHYIHQNPYKKKLVTLMEDWEHSSFKDYVGMRGDLLCNQQLAFDLLALNREHFYDDAYKMINSGLYHKLF